MFHSYFRKSESLFHVCDNYNISASDKWAKLRPLLSLINQKLFSLEFLQNI